MKTTAVAISIAACLCFCAGIRAAGYDLDKIISRGNTAYKNYQRTKVKESADSLAAAMKRMQLKGDSLKDYTVSLNKLYGNYHYLSAEFDSAAYYYSHALDIINANENTAFHQNRTLMPRELAQLYYRLEQYDKAVEALEPVIEDMEFNQRPAPFGDDWLLTYMTYAISLARTGQITEALEIAEREMGNASDRLSPAFALAQRMYAKILLLGNVDRKGATDAYKEYFITQKREAFEKFAEMTAREREEYWQTLYPFITDCYRLEEADPDFLYDVALFSKGLLLQLERISGDGKATEEALKSLTLTREDIQRQLGEGDIAIEYIAYEKEGNRHMGALLLERSGNTRFIPIATGEEVETIAGKALGSTGSSGKSRLYRNRRLQESVWPHELLEAITDAERIYFSPDGYLHRLAIEYMPQVEGKKMYRLTSTRRLAEAKRKIDPEGPMLLVGSIDYDYEGTPMVTAPNDSVAFSHYAGKWFPRLDEADDETLAIYRLRANPTDTRISGAEASEYAFRKAAPGHGMILVSTHGDFHAEEPVVTDVKEIYGGDALSGNIIALAGVNHHLSDTKNEYADRYDGLLSAAELAELDLGACRLFAVSACRSGLGEITADGVFGLQRGLKMAGVDAMIVSLWSVDSEATDILMRRLYENLHAGMTAHDALGEARKWLKKGLVATPQGKMADYTAPKFTDAFILIDGN